MEPHFESKFVPEAITGCYLWTAATNRGGYGVYCISKKTLLAHRFAYEAEKGPIGPGLQIDHKCRNKSCVNPAHLEAVTQSENTRRSLSPNILEHLIGKVRCKNGHSFTPDNTYVHTKRGTRHCRVCQRTNERKYRARK